MLKKLLVLIFFTFIFIQTAFAQEIFRVTSVNFDTSNSMLFLGSPDNTTEAILKRVKLTKLSNPKRVYFDIDSAVLSAAPQNWFLNAKGIKEIKVSQFSTNPSKIRVVFFLDENFDQNKISFLRVNNNIVIKFKDGMCSNDYFQNNYRDEKTQSSDFYENLSISNEEIDKIKTMPTAANDPTLNQIQEAFRPAGSPVVSSANPTAAPASDVVKKELKLKSKYYLNLIVPKQDGFLLSGFGAAAVEKPMYLTNPARVVFDIPNAIVNPDLKNKEFKLGEDTVKIGQFEHNKVRIVITSTELEKYFTIFSSDGQSIFFSNTESIDMDSLIANTTDAASYYIRKIVPSGDEFIVAFNAPVVYSIRRDNTKLTMNFYNALRYNEQTFKNTIVNTDLKDMKIDLLPKIGLKLTLPLERENSVKCFLGSDGRAVKIVLSGVKPKKAILASAKDFVTPTKTIILPRCTGKHTVVLDPGHGGSDYGAIRAGINEKDINLDVAKRVEALLASKGVSVAMTRESDQTVSLEARTIFTENNAPELFVSIHVNSSVRPEITGVETHYYHPNSINLAQTVHSDLVSCVKSVDRGLFKSRFYVINHTSVPAILVEIGFISNSGERAELVSEQRKQQTAVAIADGILKYLNKR